MRCWCAQITHLKLVGSTDAKEIQLLTHCEWLGNTTIGNGASAVGPPVSDFSGER
jgi:hypothetical protein